MTTTTFAYIKQYVRKLTTCALECVVSLDASVEDLKVLATFLL